MKRLAEPRAGLTGREAAFPNARPAAGSGEFQIRSGNRSGLPVGPLPLISKWFLCAFARSGLPRPGALPRSSVGCADPKNPAQLPRFRVRAALAVRRFRFFCFWFPVAGVRRTTATVPNPARAANSGPRFGGSFVGVPPSIFWPLGRTGERSLLSGCRFPGPGLPVFWSFPFVPPNSPNAQTVPMYIRSCSGLGPFGHRLGWGL